MTEISCSKAAGIFEKGKDAQRHSAEEEDHVKENHSNQREKSHL